MIIPLRVVGFALVLLSLPVLTACGLDGGGSSAFTFSGDGDPPPLEFEMDVPASVRAGETASFLLHVRNASIWPLNLFSAVPPHEFEVHDSSGERVWSSFMSEHFDARAGELRLVLGVRASVAGHFDLEPREEVVLDAEWDTATISEETASPGVYFVSAIVSISREGSGGPDFLFELEPIMITVTGSGADSARAAEAP